MHIFIWIISGGCFVLGAVIVVSFVFFNFLKKQIREENKMIQEQFLQMAKQELESGQNRSTLELETRKLAVENSVNGLKEQLNKYQQLIREFEKDRDVKYGSLETELKNVSKGTSKLQGMTARLNDILGNVKLRGQWGERMAEDIICNAGLIEEVNYRKQKKLGYSETKPDYTFFLPGDHIVNMDVKFPLDNYLNMINSNIEIEKEKYQKEFIRNIRQRIKEIQSRDYINPAENTLDFVLLFIPNEQVFGVIQEIVPGLMDESLKQKVVLCSPFTLYAMLSIIRQAYENFRFEKDVKEIIRHIELFVRHYDKFKLRFNEIGKFIEILGRKFDEVKNTDFKKLDTKIRHIEDYKKGNKASLTGEPGHLLHGIEEVQVNSTDKDVILQ